MEKPEVKKKDNSSQANKKESYSESEVERLIERIGSCEKLQSKI